MERAGAAAGCLYHLSRLSEPVFRHCGWLALSWPLPWPAGQRCT